MRPVRFLGSFLSRSRLRGARSFSATTLLRNDVDPLSALFEEMENCDTSVNADVGANATKAGGNGASPAAKASPSAPPTDPRVRLEEAKQKRLQRELQDVGEELNALLSEKNHAAAQEASKAYVPAGAGKTFLSSAELIQEKAPQEFIPDEDSSEELARVPALQHSGCSAVITMVGVVVSAPQEVHVVFPGDAAQSSCVEFAVRYEVPFASVSTLMVVTVRVIGATLSTFARENIGIGAVVHVLGHLAPFDTLEARNSSCAIYVLPAGGNLSVVLSGSVSKST